MKILLGICGFGNGHSARQADVLAKLNERGHDVVLFVFLNSKSYVEKHFSQNQAFEIRVPIIHVTDTGIDFGRTANEPFNRFDDDIRLNYGAMQGVLDYFQGKPDVVISDYELVAAQFAYAQDIPLVTIDQQSKFAGYQLPDIVGFSRLEEKSRLSMFFPKAEVRYATSFFQLPWETDPSFPVQLMPPILRQRFYEAINNTSQEPLSLTQQVTVYFSPHVQLQQSKEVIYQIFNQFKDIEFVVFQKYTQDSIGNIRFEAFDGDRFLQNLLNSQGVVTTAGHNLLSELMFLGKPVYTLPANTFDQRFCAYIIEHNALGVGRNTITQNDLQHFFDHQPQYQANITNRQGLVSAYNGLDVLFTDLESRFGI